MFFDQLDERNVMVQSNHAFEELALAGLGIGLADSSRAGTSETRFLRPCSKWNDLDMFSGDRNMMAGPIIHFGHFWLSTLLIETNCILETY